MRKSVRYLLMFGLLCLLGCSGDSNGSDEITSLRFLANDIKPQESVRVEVGFTTDTDFLGDPKATELVVEVSSFLSYDLGSARIFENDGDDTGSLNEGQIDACQDGRTFVRYFFDRDTLRNHRFSGNSYKMKFNLTAKLATSSAVVRASIGSNFPASCSADFNAEQTDALKVS